MLQRVTRGTRSDRGCQGVTRGYRELKRVTRDDTGWLRVTRGYRGLQGVTRGDSWRKSVGGPGTQSKL